MSTYKKFYLFSVIVTLIVAFYPLYMGVCVVSDMIINGAVESQNYPKYVIPYTPISIAIIIAVILMPVAIRYLKKLSLPVMSFVSIVIFFVSELLFESQVFVTTTNMSITKKTTLENWQVFACYVPPEEFETRTWSTVDVLIGEYSPAFKLHFYFISLVLILAFLNCFYGFAQMIKSGDRHRLKALVLQSVSSAMFLGLCIFACFTAFFRTGELTVEPISAVLMIVFFVVFGITLGVYVGSFLLDKRRVLSVGIPMAVSILTVFIMYIGEMILLSGHLYRFGKGFLFEEISKLIFAPIDIVTMLLSGCVTAGILTVISKKK